MIKSDIHRYLTFCTLKCLNLVPIDSIVMVNDEDSVVAGQFIARIPKESIRAVKDITGGLPRVEDIFEARSPKEPAIIAEISGIANFVDDYRSKNHLIIKAEGDDSVSIGYNIPLCNFLILQLFSTKPKDL